HEVIFAEGAPSESFHPAEMGWTAMDEATREEILELFPELEPGTFAGYGDLARPTLKHYQGAIYAEFLAK
ncbi:MAG: type I secretion protein, partial [Pseudomonadota bacterium]